MINNQSLKGGFLLKIQITVVSKLERPQMNFKFCIKLITLAIFSIFFSSTAAPAINTNHQDAKKLLPKNNAGPTLDWEHYPYSIIPGVVGDSFCIILDDNNFCVISVIGKDGVIKILAKDDSLSSEDENVEISDESTIITNEDRNGMLREIYTLKNHDDMPEEKTPEGYMVFDKYIPYIKASKNIPPDIKGRIMKWFRIE